ncbi:Rieske (2Fe-2S) protein [Halospeciosus flavus]|uniref:Rieske (2Fe-2S) protein n=1 Tax=Halospeciosus flavus TaxID=3032283 RepID=A0ABD5Z4Y3_9EURY|nr:Rieske 2Fe-2S domain-containing protein [Halospeciosus flavus]
MSDGTRITEADDVPDEGSFLFTAESDGEEVEVILVRVDGHLFAWENVCQHWTDVNLDRGDGAPERDDRLVCAKHGATFSKETGYCDFGPCEGSYLTEVDVEVRDGGVFLTDEAYDFVCVGETESDGLDMSTNPGERLGF